MATGPNKILTSARTFTEASLPLAIGNLFKMNNYEVTYDVHVNGAQIDIVAQSKSDPFSKPVYVEATIEYVSTEKYGKDTTKFLLLKHKDPGCTLLCVSSVGFTANVRERALESGVAAFSYAELFAKFEKFNPYVEAILQSQAAISLVSTYEEPFFNDQKGVEVATKWLNYWKGYAPEEARWLIVLGEYGTGKTSLTRVLQYRWLQDYHSDPTLPIPVRIELRSFSRQFDAMGLLHHFLDANGLSHVPIEFMVHLIKTGRVILLLDGYDEMAQFMNSRERRACLAALAELAKDGAKGILTSRPNYFSESEELNVFEALYRSLEQQRYHLSKGDRSLLNKEKNIDELVERYVLYRFERNLQDLTPEQTKSLITRTLAKNPEGQKIVLSILAKVFREEALGARQALSGKPVIIAYLLELVEDLQKDGPDTPLEGITEWEVYKLIIDKLMLRDLNRSTLAPNERRKALHSVALRISSRDNAVATEQTFQDIIDSQFQAELRRLSPEERRARRTELFEDLRSSATLTRATATKNEGWVFSHNSLREYMAAEVFVSALQNRDPRPLDVPVSAAMRAFVASLGVAQVTALWEALGELWPRRTTHDTLGSYLILIWDAAIRLEGGIAEKLTMLGTIGQGVAVPLNSISFKDVDFRFVPELVSMVANASGSALSDIHFNGMDLSGSDFEGAILDNVSFEDANLSNCNFGKAFLFECEVSGANVDGADFRAIEMDSSILVKNVDGAVIQLSGEAALGYLSFNGATTSPVEDVHKYIHHSKFSIIQKICEKVAEQKNSQLRGLTQRGEARIDPPFARDFVDRLQSLGWITVDKNDLVSATPLGRPALASIAACEKLPAEVVNFIESKGT